jgi:hypothetical protein
MLDFFKSDTIMFVWTLQVILFLSLLITNIFSLNKMSNKKVYFFEIGYLLLLFSCLLYLHIYYNNQFSLIANDLIMKGNSLSTDSFAKNILHQKEFPIAEIILSFFILFSSIFFKILHSRKITSTTSK